MGSALPIRMLHDRILLDLDGESGERSARKRNSRNRRRTRSGRVVEGEADLVTQATGEPDRLAAGDALLIPAGRVYGLRAVSPRCAYDVHVAG